MIRLIKLIFFIIFSFSVALFTAVNSHDTTIHFIPGSYEIVIPVSVLILASALIGILLDQITYASSWRQLSKTCKKQEKEIKALKSELASARTSTSSEKSNSLSLQ